MNTFEPSVTTLPRLLLDIKGVVQYVSLSRAKIRRMVRLGQFPKPFRIGRNVRWKVCDVTAWVEQQIAAQS